ncbi:hypothetical protein, partial [Morganella morganii]|uniref:hypothetical protein n=1 Tax=Morganella morganii TaxID=582 RepID=UPI001C7161E0
IDKTQSYGNKVLAGVRQRTSSGEKDTHPDDMGLSEYMTMTDIIIIFYLRDSDYFYITSDIIIR